MEKQKVGKIIFEYALIAVLAVIDAFNFSLLIIGNFVPMGLPGVGVMIQYLAGGVESAWFSWFSLIANLPICVILFMFFDKQFALKSFVYVAVLSIAYFLLSRFTDITDHTYHSDNVLLPVLAASVVSGLIYGVMFNMNASTGGMDVIGKIVSYLKPQLNFIWVSFSFSALVAVASYFVMGNDIEQVILCIIFTFTASFIGSSLLKLRRSALKVEIVTNHAKEISDKIISELHHTATVTKAQGMYTKNDYDLLICVINKRQLYDLEQILKQFPDTFAYISQVNSTVGLFNRGR